MVETLSRAAADGHVTTENPPPWKRVLDESAHSFSPPAKASVARFKAIRTRLDVYERAAADRPERLRTS